jgi:glutamate dehydrogenase/leucine dehydrogenase
MRKGLDMNEVLSLAKTMEVKFSVSGPAIGGAKSGINFDQNDQEKIVYNAGTKQYLLY